MKRNSAKRRGWIVCLLLAVMVSIAAGCVWGNTALVTTRYELAHADIPAGFDGFRIVQLSDVHDACIGEDNAKLLAAVEAAEPDIIVLTGDFIDSNRTDIGHSLSLAQRLAQLAPTYYANGNHEAKISPEDYAYLTEGLSACGIDVLENEDVILERGDAQLQLIGLMDIGHMKSELSIEARIKAVVGSLSALKDSSLFSVVLAHRPELADTYAACGVELVLAGHAHGGQVRLPFIGGLIAPGQGLFPEYDAGCYAIEDMKMIVSRGIGNSVIPLRINNRPEIVVIDLQHE